MKARRFRDLTFVEINDEQLLVIACDSSGAIGSKENDIVKVSPDILGYFTTNVALCEILSVGGDPFVIVNTLSVEMNDTGSKIIEGIKRAIEPIPNKDIIITGSTEENFPVIQTGMGITVIGIINTKDWVMPMTKKGAIAVVVGLPKIGEEVIADNGKEIFSLKILLELKKYPFIQEILPVGSKGILFELKEMARTNGLNLSIFNDIKVDLYKSAGPATCAIVSIEEKYFDILKDKCPIPINKVARFN
ncbi:AIR synthase related protein [Caloranaerobacter azorensis]|uniref:Selenophosphate synthase n=1 Tax=Caloranaerobacter azorensis TaxID=116090 RepID=A0A6P1YF62_9FIRM|nr:AIR synthase related protein [Caloranaerobacter azorensis]QIB26795.1 selenophosphate synthase [Caloranaerobacter azorensis]